MGDTVCRMESCRVWENTKVAKRSLCALRLAAVQVGLRVGSRDSEIKEFGSFIVSIWHLQQGSHGCDCDDSLVVITALGHTCVIWAGEECGHVGEAEKWMT